MVSLGWNLAKVNQDLTNEHEASNQSLGTCLHQQERVREFIGSAFRGPSLHTVSAFVPQPTLISSFEYEN